MEKIKKLYISISFVGLACGAVQADKDTQLRLPKDIEFKCQNVDFAHNGTNVDVQMTRCENTEVVCYFWHNINQQCKFK